MSDTLRTPAPATTDWKLSGLCAQIDPEAFFPDKGGSVRAAKRICSQCPVQTECLSFALTNNERFGIWGGVTESERRPLRQRLKATNPSTERCLATVTAYRGEDPKTFGSPALDKT